MKSCKPDVAIADHLRIGYAQRYLLWFITMPQSVGQLCETLFGTIH